MSTFSAQEYQRYSRHIQLPQVGATGQTQLKQSRIVIVGCGGLGAPVSLYLAAAGIGNIVLVDGDNVELSNLHRQITFAESDIGNNKALCTANRIAALNSDINIVSIKQHLNTDNAKNIFDDGDLILDCTDNFSARHLINKTCKTLRKPWVYASVSQFSGQCAVFSPDKHCYECVFPQKPAESKNCNTEGVLGTVPGLIGTLQANQAIHYLLQIEENLDEYLLMVETLDWQMQKIQLAPSNSCKICHPNATTTNNKNLNEKALDLTITPKALNESNQLEISQLELTELPLNSYQLIDVRSDSERTAFHIGGIHIPIELLEQQLASSLSAQSTQQLEQLPHQFDKGKIQIIYCHSGARSTIATQLLKKHGYTARSLAGGIVAAIQSQQQTLPPLA